jgi:D-arabinose 1-dehydrogenase-like Zn-dependent alcohol dehydrogenase
VGARIVLVGSVMKSDDIRVNPEQMIRRCWQIHGIHNYTPADLLVAVEFLLDQYQTYPFAELVSQTFPLREINTALRFAYDHRPVRIAIRP